MASYFVHTKTGSDAADGLTSAAAKLTFAGLRSAYTIASGDTIYIAETSRETLDLSDLELDDITIKQDPDGTQAWMQPGIEVGTGFTNTSGNLWEKTIAPGLDIDGVLFKYGQAVDADGHHFGHLDAGNPATTANTFDYNAGSGVLRINVPSSPNSFAVDVIVQAGIAGTCCIEIAGGARPRVEGIKFGPMPTDDLGYAVRMSGCTDPVVTGCRLHDCGSHAIGFVLGSTNPRSINNRYYGGWSTSSPIVFHTDTTDLEGSESSGDTIRAARYKTPSGTAMTTQGAMVQTGIYSHSNGPNVVYDITVTDLSWHEDENGSNLPYAADNLASGQMIRDSQSTIRFIDSLNFAGVNAWIDRTRFYNEIALDGAAAFAPFTMNSASAITNVVRLEACELNMTLDTATGAASGRSRMFRIAAGGGATARFDLVNNSVNNRGTDAAADFRAIFDYVGVDRDMYRCYGNVFEHLTAGSTYALCIDDSGVSAANHVFLDNRYRRIGTGRYSQRAAIDTEAEFMLGVDTNGGVLATSAFPNAPDDLSINSSSSVWTPRRATPTNVPTHCINGPYIGAFGAYQPPVNDNGGRSGIGISVGAIGLGAD